MSLRVALLAEILFLLVLNMSVGFYVSQQYNCKAMGELFFVKLGDR